MVNIAGRALVVSVLLQFLVNPVCASIVLFDDFDGGLTVAPGVSAIYSGYVSLEGVQGYAGLGPSGNQFGGSFLRNPTGGIVLFPYTGVPGLLTTLTLTGLPAHSALNLGFLLATIDSWDGADGTYGPDWFNVRVDGAIVFKESFAQAGGSIGYAFPPGGQLGVGNYGFGGGSPPFFQDGAYNIYLEPTLQNIPHTSSTLIIDFFADGAGWQGNQGQPPNSLTFDESWAIENLRVDLITAAVPEPTAALCWTGLCLVSAVGLLARRLATRGRIDLQNVKPDGWRP
jgi:hypothetical protein